MADGGPSPDPETTERIDTVRGLMSEADSMVVVSGAGMSAESGVPTFRGEEGLWKEHRPEELATPEAFRRDPRLVWEWYAWRRELVAGCEPNAGHVAVARLQTRRGDVSVVTQNVDGLHERALLDETGSASAEELDPELRPLELHGSLFRVRCTGCGDERPHRATVDASARDTLPRCPGCGELLRPAVVWFGESLDSDLLGRAFARARSADLCLVVGTSAVVEPAASVPLATLEGGGRIVEVNPEATPLSSSADVVVRAPAGTVLPALVS